MPDIIHPSSIVGPPSLNPAFYDTKFLKSNEERGKIGNSGGRKISSDSTSPTAKKISDSKLIPNAVNTESQPNSNTIQKKQISPNPAPSPTSKKTSIAATKLSRNIKRNEVSSLNTEDNTNVNQSVKPLRNLIVKNQWINGSTQGTIVLKKGFESEKEAQANLDDLIASLKENDLQLPIDQITIRESSRAGVGFIIQMPKTTLKLIEQTQIQLQTQLKEINRIFENPKLFDKLLQENPIKIEYNEKTNQFSVHEQTNNFSPLIELSLENEHFVNQVKEILEEKNLSKYFSFDSTPISFNSISISINPKKLSKVYKKLNKLEQEQLSKDAFIALTSNKKLDVLDANQWSLEKSSAFMTMDDDEFESFKAMLQEKGISTNQIKNIERDADLVTLDSKTLQNIKQERIEFLNSKLQTLIEKNSDIYTNLGKLFPKDKNLSTYLRNLLDLNGTNVGEEVRFTSGDTTEAELKDIFKNIKGFKIIIEEERNLLGQPFTSFTIPLKVVEEKVKEEHSKLLKETMETHFPELKDLSNISYSEAKGLLFEKQESYKTKISKIEKRLSE